MSKNLQSPTKLTEFAPLQPEEKPQSVGQLISKFFKINKTTTEETTHQQPNNNADNISQESLPTWAIDVASDYSKRESPDFTNEVNEGRRLPNVLKRISDLLALKSNVRRYINLIH